MISDLSKSVVIRLYTDSELSVPSPSDSDSVRTGERHSSHNIIGWEPVPRAFRININQYLRTETWLALGYAESDFSNHSQIDIDFTKTCWGGVTWVMCLCSHDSDNQFLPEPQDSQLNSYHDQQWQYLISRSLWYPCVGTHRTSSSHGISDLRFHSWALRSKHKHSRRVCASGFGSPVDSEWKELFSLQSHLGFQLLLQEVLVFPCLALVLTIPCHRRLLFQTLIRILKTHEIILRMVVVYAYRCFHLQPHSTIHQRF